MAQLMWPRITKDRVFFAGMLLVGSTQMDSFRGNRISDTSVALKCESIRLVRERMRQSDDFARIACLSGIACLATSGLVRS